MKTSIVKYLGDLRTENEHVRSGQKLITDAPVDNQGRGEAFSPTDLVATALADCIITIMGIRSRDMNIDLTGTRLEVLKEMNENPRRIKAITIDIYFPALPNLKEKDKQILEKIVSLCPVSQSLHPDVQQHVTLHFQ